MLDAVKAALRNGATVYGSHGLEHVSADVCSRTFTLHCDDVQTCSKYLRGYCYRQFHGGQMEQVLDNLVAVSYIHSPRQALIVLNELRKMGVCGKIDLCVEYVEGHLVPVKTF